MVLRFLVEKHKKQTGLSYEKMARIVDLSRNQFMNVLESGFSDATRLKTIRGFAKLLGMKTWELLRLLDEEDNKPFVSS